LEGSDSAAELEPPNETPDYSDVVVAMAVEVAPAAGTDQSLD
jgi:hypothetical protein